jgi:hypothetical protein
MLPLETSDQFVDDVRVWHEPELLACPLNGRYRGESRHGVDCPFWSRMTQSRLRTLFDHAARISRALALPQSNIELDHGWELDAA